MKLSTVWMLSLVSVLSLLGRAMGDIGAAHVAITDELQQCASPFGSLQRSLAVQFNCITESLYRCVMYREVEEHEQKLRLQYCGVINSGRTLPFQWFFLSVPPRFILKLNFIHFYLPFVVVCYESISLEVHRPAPTPPYYRRFLAYCGHRRPWSLALKNHDLMIIYADRMSLIMKDMKDYYFVMSYEAFDYVPATVGVTQVKQERWHNQIPSLASFNWGRRGAMFVEVQYLFHVYHDCVITVYYSSGLSLDLVSFDGPGPLSPRIQSAVSGEHRVIRSSSFLLFITVYKPTGDDDKGRIFDRAEQRFSLDLKYNESVRAQWPDNCIRSASGGIRFTGTHGHCLALRNIEHLTIHKLTFTGFNAMLHTIISQHCHYGGLFMLLHYVIAKNQIVTLVLNPFCANITSEVKIPTLDQYYVRHPHDRFRKDYKIKDVRLVFLTFEGYSSGFVDISLHSEEDCVGMNRALFEPFTTGKTAVEFIWPDLPRDTVEKPSLKECTDDWLTFNLATLDIIKLKDSQRFYFQAGEERNYFLQWKYGNHSYRGSKLIVTSSLLSRTGRNSWGEFNMSLAMTKASEVPGRYHVASYRANLLQERRLQWDDVAGVLSVTLNYSGHDPNPVFVVRLQLIHHHVCASVVFDGSSDVTQSFLFAGAHQDISVSRDFIYNAEMLGIWGYTAQRLGACRLLLTGLACSDGLTEYHIARVSLDATGFDLAVEVDISLKKVESCSVHCALHIRLAEAGPEDQHVAQWSGVRRLKWQLKNLYFSTLDLRSVCLDCQQKLCDVSLAIRVVKPWIPLLADDKPMPGQIEEIIGEYQARFFPEHLLREYLKSEHASRYLADAVQSELTEEDGVYGYRSWQDAHNQCVGRHNHLPIWTPTLASQLTAVLQRHDYDMSPERLLFTTATYTSMTKRIFAGLYRHDQTASWAWHDGSPVRHIGWGQMLLHPDFRPVLSASPSQLTSQASSPGGLLCSAYELFQGALTLIPINCSQPIWTYSICQKQLYPNSSKLDVGLFKGKAGYWIRNDNSLVQGSFLCPNGFNLVASNVCIKLKIIKGNNFDATMSKTSFHDLTKQLCPPGITDQSKTVEDVLPEDHPLYRVITEFYDEAADVVLPSKLHTSKYIWMPGLYYPKYIPCFTVRNKIERAQTAVHIPGYECVDGSVISNALVCNGRTECPHGEDERDCVSCSVQPCLYSCNVPECVCAMFYYQCNSGECVHYDHVCDSIPNCPDGDDELFCHRRKVFPRFDGNFIQSLSVADLCVPSNDMLMCRTGYQCYNASAICHYDHSDGVMAHCADASHLGTGTLCAYIECSRHQYKCHESYCIPTRKVCDGFVDCPEGDDEARCVGYRCPGHMRCSGATYCVSPHEVCDGIAHCPQQEDEKHCQDCPSGCQCKGSAVYCFNTASIPENFSPPSALVLHNSYSMFSALYSRSVPTMSYAWLVDLKHGSFHAMLEQDITLLTVKVLYLNHQGLRSLRQNFMIGPNLLYLNLSHNQIEIVQRNAFASMANIRILALDANRLRLASDFLSASLKSLSHLYLRDNPLVHIATDLFRYTPQLALIRSDWYMVCCVAPGVEDCEPKNQFVSSCSNLISSLAQRVVITLQGMEIIVSNVAAVAVNVRWKLSKGAEKYLILSLILADLLMGIYLLGISGFDLTYAGRFYEIVPRWTSGLPCMLLGLSNFLSVEVSVAAVCMLSLARVQSVKKIGGMSTIKSRIKAGCLSAWVATAAIGTFCIAYLSMNSMKVRNNMCILLCISNQRFITSFERLLQIALISLNVVFLILVSSSMVALFTVVHKSFKSFQDIAEQKRRFHDTKLASLGLRLSLMLGCNIVSWLPFLVVSILSVSGQRVHENVLQWVAVLCIPICACADPFLYTMTSLRARKKP